MKEFLANTQAAKAELRCSERRLCRSLALPRSTYRRWHRRQCDGVEIIQAPGPKKTQPLPLEQLELQLAELPHHGKRTPGSGALLAQYSQAISRRDFHSLLGECRTEQRRAHRQELQQVVWHLPNLAWAIDGAEYLPDGQCQKLLFVATQDLCSSHRFAPLPALNLTGEQVAEHLEQLFREHGAPLILKRDHGSIFNNQAVDDALARWHVLPLNSPPYYPPYNGGIEKGIREIKSDLPKVLPPPPAWDIECVTPILAAVCLQQNTQPRRRLDGRTACEAYAPQRCRRFSKRERRNIFESILSDVRVRVSQMEEPDRHDFHAAWRAALVHWLVCQKLISLSQKTKPTKSVTPFSENVVS